MRQAAIPVMFLAFILAISNSVCAISCSTDSCHKLPPCHQQHQQAKICQGAAPTAELTTPAIVAPALASVATIVEPRVSIASPFARFRLTPESDPSSPTVLRI